MKQTYYWIGVQRLSEEVSATEVVEAIHAIPGISVVICSDHDEVARSHFETMLADPDVIEAQEKVRQIVEAGQ